MAVIKNTRDIGLQSRGVNYRIMKPSITIASYSTSPAGYSYFSKPANSTTLVPASLTLLVTDSFSPGNYSVPVYNWDYSTSADPATYISLGVNTLGLTITNTNFAIYAGTGNSVNFRLTVSQAGWTTSTQIYVVDYYRTLAITPVVSLSRSDIILPVSTLGVINYTGTGTNIRVSINNVNIPYDVAGTAGPNTFTVTAVGSTTPNTVTVGVATTTTTTVSNDTRTFADISGLAVTVNPGSIVYTITVRDADGTVSVFTRTQSVVVSLTGATGTTGTNGVNSATVNLYNKNTTTTAPALFSGTFTYTFATGVLSGGTLNGWTQTPPAIAAGEFLFISLATASSITATDSITAAEFSAAQTISGVGVDGANTAVVTLFNKNTSAVTPPTTFSGTFTYTFATAVLSAGTLNGWSQSAPSLSTGEYLWVRQATAFAIATTDTILSTEFSAAVINGAAGTNAKALSITADSYIFKADTDNAIPVSAIKLTANKQNTTNTVSWSTVPAISLHSAASGGSIVTTGDIVYLQSASYAANTSVTVTATIAADSLSDSCSIVRIRDGSLVITPVLSNPVMPLATTAAGVVTYTGSGTTLQVYEGSTLRTITAVTSTATNITVGTISGTGTTTVTIGDHSAITQDNAKIIYTVTITKGDGTSGTNIIITQSFTKSKAGTNGTNGTNGATGATGAVGNSAVICYALYSGNPTVTGAAVTINQNTNTGLPNTTSFSPTSATAFSYTVQTPGSAQAMFQSNGIYDPVANQTIWNTPYLSNLKVGSLEAISANMGSLTSGTITGALIRTAAGPGRRVVMEYTSNELQVYDATDVLSVRLGGTTGQLYVNNNLPASPGASFFNNSNSAPALWAYNSSTTAPSGAVIGTSGIYGQAIACSGVTGEATTGKGVEGVATSGSGVIGTATTTGNGVVGVATTGNAVQGTASSTGNGVVGVATTGNAVQGTASSTGNGVVGTATSGNAVQGTASTTGVGVFGTATLVGGNNHGVRGRNLATNGIASQQSSGIVGSSAGYDFYADGAALNYGPFTGAHDVLVPVAQSVPVGYIVCDVELIVAKNISNTVFKVAMSTATNQVAVGIMVLNNGLLANAQPAAFIERVDWTEIDGNMQNTTVMRPEYDVVKDLYNYCAVNAVGEGQVYVCGESGNIAAGDLIVTSSVAGVGMKQSDNIVRNVTVAKARQAVTFTDLTTPVLVACIYLCG